MWWRPLKTAKTTCWAAGTRTWAPPPPLAAPLLTTLLLMTPPVPAPTVGASVFLGAAVLRAEAAASGGAS